MFTLHMELTSSFSWAVADNYCFYAYGLLSAFYTRMAPAVPLPARRLALRTGSLSSK